MCNMCDCQAKQTNACMNVIPTNELEVQQLVLSPSLFLRLMEWAKEEAQGDVCLHQVLEKLLNLNNNTGIGIDMYDYLLDGVSCGEDDNGEQATSADIENAMELGYNQAIKADSEGYDLSDDGPDYSMVAGKLITDYKDNGFGASNAEIDAFWDGVEQAQECDDCQLFDDSDAEGLSALNQFRQKFNIEVTPKEEPKATLTITPEEDDEIERIIKLAQFK